MNINTVTRGRTKGRGGEKKKRKTKYFLHPQKNVLNEKNRRLQQKLERSHAYFIFKKAETLV